jgi:phosphohistidine swiveling domain-containing protein
LGVQIKMKSTIINLHELSGNHSSKELGPKAYGLFLVIKAGYQIPSTQVIPPHYFNQHLSKLKSYQDYIDEVSTNPTSEQVVVCWRSFKEEFKQIDWSELSSSVTFHQKMIMRSNMSVEDGRLSSFAGQFLSLEYRDEDQFLSTLETIILDALSPEKLLLVMEGGAPPSSIQPSIILQPLLELERSGILFSFDPLATDNRMLIEEVQGGLSDYADGKQEAKRIHLSENNNDQYRDHFELVKKLEKEYSSPLDVEWGIHNGQLIILQVRAATDLQSQYLYQYYRKGNIWDREEAFERFPQKITPLSWSSIQNALINNLEVMKRDFFLNIHNPEDLARYENFIVYTNPNFFKLGKGLSIRKGELISFLLQKIGKALLRLPKLIFHLATGKGKAGLLLYLLDIVMLERANEIRSKWTEHCEQFESDLNKLNQTIETKSIEEVFDEIDRIAKTFLINDIPIYLIKKAYFSAYTPFFKTPELILKKLNSFTISIMSEVQRELSAVKQVLEKDQAYDQWLNGLDNNDLNHNLLNHESREKLAFFLDKYGEMAYSWELKDPVLKNDPKKLLSLLSNASTTAIENNSEVTSDYYLKLIADFMLIDDEQHLYTGKLIAATQRIINRCQTILLQKNRIQFADDIYFLDTQTMKEMITGSVSWSFIPYIENVKNQWAKQNDEPAECLPVLSVNIATDVDSDFRGVCMSQGNIEGEVFWLDGSNHPPVNTILLAETPNPVYVPHFSKAKGLVTMTGGLLSHGFVCAREFNLPALSNVKNLKKLSNGDRIKLNATAGTIEVLDAK